MECLLLRLDAPLMSFGGVVVDQINPVDAYPGRSFLVGLLGNALGWDHRQTAALQALQAGLRHASRWDLEPVHVVDYQTVDLGQEALVDTGWTTRGHREDRGSGGATSGTHQRWRHYWANGCATVALALPNPDNDLPSLDALENALRRPARPLFIGRKTCMPAVPLLLGRRVSPSLREALIIEPLAEPLGRQVPKRVRGCWPIEECNGSEVIELEDLRDWVNNVHRGRQHYAVGYLETAI